MYFYTKMTDYFGELYKGYLFQMKKKGLIKKLTVLFIAFTTVLTPLYASAAPGSTDPNSYLTTDSNGNITNSEIQGYESQKQDAQSQVTELNSQLVELMAEVENLKDQIAEKQQEIDDATQDIADAEASEQQQYEMMKKRMRYIYENSDKNVITLFFESSSFSDFLDRVQYTNSIYDSDKEMLDSYEATKLEIQDMKKGLELEQLDLENQQKEMEAKQTSLNAMLAQAKQTVADFDTKIAAARTAAKQRAAELARQAEAEIAAENARKVAAAKLAAQQQQTATTADSNDPTAAGSSQTATDSNATAVMGEATESLNPAPTTGVSGSAVVAYASQFIGNPYVWGGNSLTNGIDCSGFVVQVYKHFGIDLSGYRYSGSLRSVGKAVTYENIQAGDIICYNGHVGIATGAGTIVEAQGKNTGITNYRPYTCHQILAIRRVI